MVVTHRLGGPRQPSCSPPHQTACSPKTGTGPYLLPTPKAQAGLAQNRLPVVSWPGDLSHGVTPAPSPAGSPSLNHRKPLLLQFKTVLITVGKGQCSHSLVIPSSAPRYLLGRRSLSVYVSQTSRWSRGPSRGPQSSSETDGLTLHRETGVRVCVGACQEGALRA